jgi:hypothetical protein
VVELALVEQGTCGRQCGQLLLGETVVYKSSPEHGGKLVGVVTTLGFAVVFVIHQLD